MDPLQIGDVPPLDADEPPATAPAALCTLLAPMRIEAAALRRGLPDDTGGLTVRAAGVGFRRARRAAQAEEVVRSHAVAVAGTGRSLSPSLRPGHVVVAAELRTDALTEGHVPGTLRLSNAPLIAAALRRHGLPVHTGAVISTDQLSDPTDRSRLARTGALLADLESAWLLAAHRDRPVACVRVVVRPGLTGLRPALRVLPRVAAALKEWSATLP